jgi:hypothetical protein
MLERDRSRSSLDKAIAHTLGAAYGNLSRRSFLSVLTRRLIGLTSVVVAAEVLPFLATPVKAAPQYVVDDRCGLHGYICGTGNCRSGVVGHKWVQCCEAAHYTGACPSKWSCCQYTDYCGTEPLAHAGCTGFPPSGTSWCGSAPNTFYRCTKITCIENYNSMHDTHDACKTACMSANQATYCADDPLL